METKKMVCNIIMRKLSIEIIMNEGRETRSFEGANGS